MSEGVNITYSNNYVSIWSINNKYIRNNWISVFGRYNRYNYSRNNYRKM